MKRNILVAILLLAIFTYSCTIKEEPLQDSLSPMSDLALVDDGSIVDEPIVLVEGFIPDKEDFPDTKTALSFDNSGAKFTFVNGDRLGIFAYSPAGVQMPFDLKSSEASSAVFNCPGFSLRSGTAYAAYYPYNSSASSHSSIPVNYANQWQPTAAAPASSTSANFNISSADYLMAQATPSGNACSFKMSHIGALVVMDVTVSQSLTYTEVSLNSSSASFIQTGTLNLGQTYTQGTTSSPTQGIAITSTSTANKMTLKLGSSNGDGIYLTAGTYRFCMMVPPTNVTGTVTIRLKDNSNVEHIAYVGTKNLRQGYAYRYTCTLDTATSLYDRDGSTANSYIIPSSGTYYLPTTIAGNGRAVDWAGIGFTDSADEAYPTGGGVSLSGNGVAVILNQNSCISDVIFSSNRIYFKASGAKGNAKVSLTNNGTKVWTWHIWCTNQPGTYSLGGYTVMDRNMGAITAGYEGEDSLEEATGFYYPYGSPYGFTVNEYSYGIEGGTMYTMKQYFQHPEGPYLRDKDGLYMPFNPYAASNSTAVWARIWGNGGNKTCYDPCPAGYKVTPSAFWSAITVTAGDAWGWGYYGVKSGSCFFPFNGRVHAGSYTNYQGTTKRGYQCMDIYLSNAGSSYYEFTSRGRVFLWTSSSTGNSGYHFHARKGNTAGGEIADVYVTSDILTRGMGVRCVVGW